MKEMYLLEQMNGHKEILSAEEVEKALEVLTLGEEIRSIIPVYKICDGADMHDYIDGYKDGYEEASDIASEALIVLHVPAKIRGLVRMYLRDHTHTLKQGDSE